MKRQSKKLEIPANGLQSTIQKKEENLLTPKSQQSSDSELQNTSLQTIRTLSYGDFIKINVGLLPQPINWMDIADEYCSLIETEKAQNIFFLWKKIWTAQIDLAILETSLDLLSMKDAYGNELYDEEIALKVSELGYGFIGPDKKMLPIVRNEIGVLVVLLNQWKNEYEQMCKSGEDVKRTEMDYEKEIYSVSSNLRINIDKDKISCFSYAAILNTFIDKNKAEKTAYEKIRHGRSSR
ncbi:MAG TPA: hypothetical protein VLF89_03625 [Candidatus Saccharimonadales bacterium]|nr:hypothetical protein [Candidatus Saccharimonadales bacterium]